MTSGRAVSQFLLLSIALLLAVSCGEDGPTSPERRSLQDNRELFLNAVGRSYLFGYQNVCFCGPDTRAPVRIEVEDGAIQSVVLQSDGSDVARDRWDLYLTVEEVFATIEDALDRGAPTVRATYDPVLGYPRDVFIDYDERIADEERGFALEGVTASP